MAVFEYKVVPAPTRGLKAKGVKGTPARFANALETVMNDLGADGWEYQRTDTLPVEERQGLTGKSSSFQNMLVFRRTVEVTVDPTVEEPVAGLIEDQSEPADAVAVAPSPAANEKMDDEGAAASDHAEAPLPDGEAKTDGVLTADARDRVADTLKSDGFSFPWNNRRKASAKDTALSQGRTDLKYLD